MALAHEIDKIIDDKLRISLSFENKENCNPGQNTQIELLKCIQHPAKKLVI